MTAAQIALADCCEIVQGGRHKLSGNDFVEHGFPAYGAGGMNGLLATWEFDEAAVVLSSIGARCGKCFYVNGKWSSLANTQVIRPNPEKADCKFLWYQLNDEARWPRSGTGQPFIRPSDVKSHLVHLPPLSEQRRIAAVLDKADALRTKRREALVQLDRLAQSIFVEMFGLGEFREYSIGQLIETGALLYHKDGNHGSLYPRAEEFGEAGIPFLSAKSIDDYGAIDSSQIERLNEGKARQLKIGWIKDGDVLLSHNASVGKVAIYDGCLGEALIGTSLTAYRPNPKVLNTTFLAESLRGPRFQLQLQKNMGQTTRNQVPITAQRDLSLPLPPLELQLQFAKTMKSVEHQRALHRQAWGECGRLFASLQHRAFNGEL